MSKCRIGKQELSLNKSMFSAIEENPDGHSTYTFQMKDFYPWLGVLKSSGTFAVVGGSIAIAVGLALCSVMVFLPSDKESSGILFPVLGIALFVGGIIWFASKKKNVCAYVLESYSKNDRFYIFLPKNKLTDEQKSFIAELEAALKRYSGFESFVESFSCNCTPECFAILDQLKTDGVITDEEFVKFKKKRLDEAFRN